MGASEALQLAAKASRDRCRTPVQWADSANGGFSPPGVKTWLPVNPNYAEGVNAAEQLDDPDSLLNFYKEMLHLRKRTPALIAGDYEPLNEDAEDYLAFLRKSAEQSCLVALNFSGNPQNIKFDLEAPTGSLVFSNQERANEIDLEKLSLAPFEIFIAELV